jgi:tetratricopeptide (TPR) repeat protein
VITEAKRYVPGGGIRLAMLIGALVLGWIAIRAAIQSSFQDTAPQLAAQAWPADGLTLAGLARLRVAAASGEVDDTTRDLYRAALAREPLLADPLALAGMDAAAQGDPARAERLMLAARDRDPRSPLARFWLFDHFVRTGRLAEALNEVGPAIRLQPDAITAIMTVLAAVADLPEGQAALSRKLATQPFWRTAFFQTAATTSSPEAMLRLLSNSGGAADRRGAEEEQRAVFQSLINAGAGARAFETWRQLLPATYRARAQGIYDGNFGRWPGARPFNWRLAQDDIGTARMVTAGDLPQSSALDVRYFGSTSGVLAEQYVFATPGSYQLQLAARRRTTGATGGRLGMEVRCVGGEIIATLPLEPLDMQLRTMAAPVQVPAGCQLLLVRLVGTPGEVFSEVEAQITAVALVRGG